MSTYEDWELYEAFKNQCKCDKIYIKDIYKRFRVKVLVCGRRLIEKQEYWGYIIPDDKTADSYIEFLEFLDGNGFIIKQVRPRTYHIMPQYPETNELEELPF